MDMRGGQYKWITIFHLPPRPLATVASSQGASQAAVVVVSSLKGSSSIAVSVPRTASLIGAPLGVVEGEGKPVAMVVMRKAGL